MTTKTFREVIGRWSSPDALAEQIGANPETVRKWRQRNSIPAEWWSRIVDAEKYRADAITAHQLAEIAARSSEQRASA